MCGGTSFVPHPGPRVPSDALEEQEEEDDLVQGKRAEGLKEFLVKKYGSPLQAFVALDNNLSGAVTLQEFKSLVVDQLRYCADREARKLFKVLATDGVSFSYGDLGISEEAFKDAARAHLRAERQRRAMKARGLVVVRRRPGGGDASTELEDLTTTTARGRDDSGLPQHSGLVQYAAVVREFRAAMIARFGSLEEAFADIDPKLSGCFSFAEFRSALVERLRHFGEKEAIEVFRALQESKRSVGAGYPSRDSGGADRDLVHYGEFGIQKRDWRAFLKDPKAWRQQRRQGKQDRAREEEENRHSRDGKSATSLKTDRSLSELDFKEVMNLLSAQQEQCNHYNRQSVAAQARPAHHLNRQQPAITQAPTGSQATSFPAADHLQAAACAAPLGISVGSKPASAPVGGQSHGRRSAAGPLLPVQPPLSARSSFGEGRLGEQRSGGPFAPPSLFAQPSSLTARSSLVVPPSSFAAIAGRTIASAPPTARGGTMPGRHEEEVVVASTTCTSSFFVPSSSAGNERGRNHSVGPSRSIVVSGLLGDAHHSGSLAPANRPSSSEREEQQSRGSLGSASSGGSGGSSGLPPRPPHRGSDSEGTTRGWPPRPPLQQAHRSSFELSSTGGYCVGARGLGRAMPLFGTAASSSSAKSATAPPGATTRQAWRPGERDAAKDAAESLDDLMGQLSEVKKVWSDARRKEHFLDDRQRRVDEAADAVRRRPRAPFRTAV